MERPGVRVGADDEIVLGPATNSSSQRWRITDGRDPRLFVNNSSGLVLDYYGRGEKKFQAQATRQLGATGKYGQLWMILVTPSKGEIGLFNVEAKRYLGYDSGANIVSCEE